MTAPNVAERMKGRFSSTSADEPRWGRMLAAVILLLHVLGWGGLGIAVAESSDGGVGTGVTLGTGVTAYVLGLRHAFDADHIAAIDNVTRRIASVSARRPVSVGFWFALGHSTVVVTLAVALALGLGHALQALTATGTWQHELLQTAGGVVSGVFLLAVGAVNAVALVRLGRSKRGTQVGMSFPGGPLGRLLRRPVRAVRRPRQMYGVGFLFGLGFDTATEIGLLVVAATSAATGASWFGVLALPVLFTAGMVLFDTLDGAFMGVAYSWALGDPSRRRGYSILVTAISVGVALTIGAVQLVGALPPLTSWGGAVQDGLDRVDSSLLGLAILAVFFVTLAFAVRARRGRAAALTVNADVGRRVQSRRAGSQSSDGRDSR